jgi:hypothetical protein
MRYPPSSSTFVLGFLTVVEHPEQGLFGGYLLLNRTGKPLEFHCTAPIRPNRAQQILYGPSLHPFLYGEQIGTTLVRHAKAAPAVVLTDCEPALTMREHIAAPVALVLPSPDDGDFVAAPNDSPARALRLDAAHAGCGLPKSHRAPGGEMILFPFGPRQLAVSNECEADRDSITERLAGLSDAFDLDEPFGRIREAIAEARKGAR